MFRLSSCEADECPSWLSGDIGQLLQELNFTMHKNTQEVAGAVFKQDSPSAKAVLKAGLHQEFIRRK